MIGHALGAGEPVLERRYRRVLRCYPASHRAAHEREMLDLLMTGAPAGQLWPELAEVTSLLWGAFRLWLRGSGAGADRSWKDVLAIFTVAGPLVMGAGWLIGGLINSSHTATMPSMQYGMHHSADWRYEHAAAAAVWSTLAWMLSPGTVGLPLLAVATWMRRRRTAVAICVLTLAWNAVSVFPGLWPGQGRLLLFHSGTQPVYLVLAEPGLLLANGIFIAELAALLASPGPRRGRELLGRRQLRVLALTALALGACFTMGDPQLTAPFFTAAVSVLVLLLVLIRRPLMTSTGRRLALVFLLAGLPMTILPVLQLGYSGVLPQPAADWLALALPLLAAVALVVSGLGGMRRVAAWLRRPVPPSGSGPGGAAS